jgi:GntR family transcriptional regulator / MocR family aminotransferase
VHPRLLAAGAPDGGLRYDLRAGRPDVSAFPRTAWLGAMRKALNASPARALDYGDPRGRPELRNSLAAYLARARGVRVTPDRIVVCSGFTQGLGLLCQVLRGRGATAMAVEDHGLPASLAIIAGQGLEPVMLPVDEDGAVPDAAGDAQAMLLTPAHQFPLGPALASRRRAQAVRWAVDTGALIIEDDYDGEFRYDRQPVGALQALAPEQVAYAGTASKTLAPALRLGWLALPPRMIGGVIAAKARADAHTGSLEQLALAEFIDSGRYDRHIRQSRLAYRRRRDRLVSELARRAPQVRITGIAAGLHAVAELPAGQSENDVTARAARRGLALEGLGTYALGGPARGPALVIGYATPPEHGFTGAVARLCAAVSPDQPGGGRY